MYDAIVVGLGGMGSAPAYLERHVPALAGRCVDARACMYTNTPDLDFVLAGRPEFEAVAIAAGFSGHGYEFCSAVDEILADPTTEGATRHPMGLFSPDRFAAEGSRRSWYRSKHRERVRR